MKDCIQTIENIENGYKVDRNKLRAFIRTMERCCIEVYLNKSVPTDKHHQNIDDISQLVVKWYNNEIEDIDLQVHLKKHHDF